MTKEKVTRIGVSLPPDLLDQFDVFLDEKGYATRSKALADLMREALMRQEWEDDDTQVFSAVTIVYDHHTRGLSARLTDLQHDHCAEVIATTHVHIDHHRCMEIILMRGQMAEIRRLGDSLTSARGVMHGKTIFVTSSPPD